MSSPRFQRIWVIIGLITAICFPHTVQATATAPQTPSEQSVLIPLTGITQVTAGGLHTCALTIQGGVKCWGDNTFGEIGDGSQEPFHLTPVDVSGLISDVVAITAGIFHTCALTTQGGVKCWGQNDAGQIGDGSKDEDRRTPVDVSGLSSGVLAITAGDFHTCAILATGVKCWGENADGQIGDGTKGEDRLTPANVSVLGAGVRAIAAGRAHSCALSATGSVLCWGYNEFGQIGDNTTTQRSTPVPALQSDNTSAIDAGSHNTCSVDIGGRVLCWGRNSNGQIGDGTKETERFVPSPVNYLLSHVSSVSVGTDSTCALTTGGDVKCWGANSAGSVGDGSTQTERLKPVDVIGLNGPVQSIAAGFGHTCAVMFTGTVSCWGSGFNGQLGKNALQVRAIAGEVLVPATCYALNLSRTGAGTDPVATPANSPGCPPGHYLEGTKIALVASPDASHYVQSWTGTNSNQSRDPVNLIAMPAADHAAGVTYAACRILTRTHTGDGADPVAVPGHSAGCPQGAYAAGDLITLVAGPADGQRVQSWTGATQSPAAGDLVNTLTMPNSSHTVSTAYETCFNLTTSIQGQGELLQTAPGATYGCDPGAYIAGQTVTLHAAPADGWQVAGWTGTANNDTTGVSNSVIMAPTDASVGIVYAPVQQAASAQFLPMVKR